MDADDKDKDNKDKPKPLTIEDVQAIVSKTVNGTVKDHVKRALASDDFKSLIGESMKAALAATKDEGGEDADPPAGDKAKPRGGDGKYAPEFEARLKAAEKRAEKAEKLAQEEADLRKKTIAEKEQLDDRAALAAALKAKGVREELVEATVSLHYGRSVSRGEDGKLRWVEGDEEHDVATGAERWVKTPAGQAFLPPRQAAGSGGTAAGRPGSGGKVEYTDADLGGMLGSRMSGS